MSTSSLPLNAFVPKHDLLDRLQENVSRIYARQDDEADHVVEAVQVLEALPLTTAEYGTAVNRLRICVHYLKQGEWGAASYENRLVYTWLRSLIHCHEAMGITEKAIAKMASAFEHADLEMSRKI